MRLKIVLTASQPISPEKSADTVARLAAFLGLSADDFLLLPTGVNVHALPSFVDSSYPLAKSQTTSVLSSEVQEP